MLGVLTAALVSLPVVPVVYAQDDEEEDQEKAEEQEEGEGEEEKPKEMEQADKDVTDLVQEDDISRNPQAIIQLLGDSEEKMRKAEEFLADTGKGKDITNDKEMDDKLKEAQDAINEVLAERKVDIKPAGDIQSKVLQLIDRLLLTTKEKQNIAIARLEELLRKLPEQMAESQQQSQEDSEGKGKGNQPKPTPGQEPPKDPKNPATSPYNPSRVEGPGAYRVRPDESGIWGLLPEREREKILAGERDIEKFPVEYRELLKKYFEELGQPRR
jgi:hypothetical protein